VKSAVYSPSVLEQDLVIGDEPIDQLIGPSLIWEIPVYGWSSWLGCCEIFECLWGLCQLVCLHRLQAVDSCPTFTFLNLFIATDRNKVEII
jgi:hypothetical protein